MAAKAIPEGYHSITPYLIVEGAGKLLDFVRQAFGAQEIARIPGPNTRTWPRMKCGEGCKPR